MAFLSVVAVSMPFTESSFICETPIANPRQFLSLFVSTDCVLIVEGWVLSFLSNISI